MFRLAIGKVQIILKIAAPATASLLRVEADCAHSRPARISCARLLRRVFEIDLENRPNCGAGELMIIAAIPERPVVEKIAYSPGNGPPHNVSNAAS